MRLGLCGISGPKLQGLFGLTLELKLLALIFHIYHLHIVYSTVLFP